MAKYIFVTGGVTSSLGKGIIAASLAKLLQLTQGLGLTLTLTGWQVEGTTRDSHTNTKVSAS